jgi:hypothetical protein
VGRRPRVSRKPRLAAPSTPKYFGAVERVLYLVIAAWLVLVGVGLT